jgi:hypothetical protein
LKHWLEMVAVLLQAETSNLRELCRIAGGDPRTFYRGVDPKELELTDDDWEFFQQDAVAEALERIGSSRRQEERVALALDQILRDKRVGLLALQELANERSKFAKFAFDYIRRKIDPLSLDRATEAAVVAGIFNRLYQEVYPFNKAALMYYFAMHLGKYPTIRTTIQSRLNRSRSRIVAKGRNEVQRLLDDAAKKHPAVLRGARSRTYGRAVDADRGLFIRVILKRELSSRQRALAKARVAVAVHRFGLLGRTEVEISRQSAESPYEFGLDLNPFGKVQVSARFHEIVRAIEKVPGVGKVTAY